MVSPVQSGLFLKNGRLPLIIKLILPYHSSEYSAMCTTVSCLRFGKISTLSVTTP